MTHFQIPPYRTVPQVAYEVGVHLETFRRMIRNGEELYGIPIPEKRELGNRHVFLEDEAFEFINRVTAFTSSHWTSTQMEESLQLSYWQRRKIVETHRFWGVEVHPVKHHTELWWPIAEFKKIVDDKLGTSEEGQHAAPNDDGDIPLTA